MIDRLTEPFRLAAVGALALAAGFSVALGWAVFVHGPAQFTAGEAAARAELTEATNRAAREITNEADRARFLRRQCNERGGMYDFVSGECVR